MIWIDFIIITIIFFSCLLGFIYGFFREISSLLISSFIFFIVNYYYTYLSVWLMDFENESIRNEIFVTTLFITLMVVSTIINCMIGQLVKKINKSKIDKVLGICFGVLRGILIISAILFFLDIFGLSKDNNWKKSKLIPKFDLITEWFFNYL